MANAAIKPVPQISAAQFARLLLAWYDAHARKLPWRETSDPYRVWVSEIMLQQTRVSAVIAHYQEFMRGFPNVESLARAGEAAVLTAWSGLGYYRRARLLHAAAKFVVRELKGQFPETTAGWRALPGVGPYTAAAIASIAFQEPVAAVDGNVERVLQRLCGRSLKRAQLWSEAGGLLARARPGDFNQAMMELGATVCTPRAPACLACPVLDLCATRGELDFRIKHAPQRKKEIHYSLYRRAGSVLLVRRAGDAQLMAGMWELPELASPKRANIGTRIDEASHNGQHRSRKPLFTVSHSITVTDYTVRVWDVSTPHDVPGKWISLAKLGKLPLTGLARKILRKAELF